MAKLEVKISQETCDWCFKSGSILEPVFSLVVNAREGRHYITVHRACLLKRMDKADKSNMEKTG